MYFAHCDPSGGRQDSMTLAIAHAEGDVVVLDLIREVRAPFNPASAVLDFSETIARYGLSQLRSDRYGAEWVVAAFRDHRVMCQPAEMAASDYYRELLPLINSRRVILLDDRRLIAQLESLERRVGALGKDQITHPPMAHDDIANSAAAALVAASRRPAVATWEADAIAIGRSLAAAGGGSPWSDDVIQLDRDGERTRKSVFDASTSDLPPWDLRARRNLGLVKRRM
jgi:hypothetical protein